MSLKNFERNYILIEDKKKRKEKEEESLIVKRNYGIRTILFILYRAINFHQFTSTYHRSLSILSQFLVRNEIYRKRYDKVDYEVP